MEEPTVTSIAASWEERTLPPLPDGARGWSGRDEPYQAAVPAALADAELRLSMRTLAQADDATILLAKYSATPMSGSLADAVVAVEAIASSDIEGYRVNALDLAAAYDRVAFFREDNQLVAANAAATVFAASAGGFPALTTHATLLSGTHPEWTGRWRDQQVWIGAGPSPHSARFVPPHHERVAAAMADLTAFAARADLPVLAQAAVAHAQFQTIHPFPDGNGRAGRALIHTMLRTGSLAGDVIVPISAGFARRTREYVDALQAFRAGDPNPIVLEFAYAVLNAVHNAERLRADLADVERQTAEKLAGVRRDSAAHRLAQLSFRSPVLSSGLAARLAAVSASSAHVALDRLVERGVLDVYEPGFRRNRLWVNAAVLEARDDFSYRRHGRGRS